MIPLEQIRVLHANLVEVMPGWRRACDFWRRYGHPGLVPRACWVEVALTPGLAHCMGKDCRRDIPVKVGDRIRFFCPRCRRWDLEWVICPEVERVKIVGAHGVACPYTTLDWTIDLRRWINLTSGPHWPQADRLLWWLIWHDISYRDAAEAYGRVTGAQISHMAVKRLRSRLSETYETVTPTESPTAIK